MTKFISNRKNPYAAKSDNVKAETPKGKFISKSNTGTIQMFRNNTTNITGRKVSFKHV